MIDLNKRIIQAKELLNNVRHVPIATVNNDGSPHNSPVFAAFDDELNMYWASSPKALHSQNIVRDGRVFSVLLDSIEEGGGLYIEAEAHEVTESEFEHALAVFNKKRREVLREIVSRENFTGQAPQRLYCAKPVKFWVNMTSKNEEGNILEDRRYEIQKESLRP